MKLYFFTVFTFLFCSMNPVVAQKNKNGSFEFLKETKTMNVVFDYSKAKINQKSERDFLDFQCLRGGEKWRAKWESEVKQELLKKFADYCNRHFIGAYDFRVGNYPDSRFQLTVFVINLEEYNGLDAKMVFTDKTTNQEVLSFTLYTKGGMYGSTENLFGDSYRRSGDKVGKLLAKKMYRMKLHI